MALKQLLADQEAVAGAVVQLPSPGLVELCAHAGFDFVLVDAEHGPIDPGGAEEMVRAAEASGVATLVRVPDGNASTIGRFLDCGAEGVLVPHVSSAEDARTAVRAARLPPVGERSVGRSRAAAYGARGDLFAAVRSRDEGTVVGVMVEDRAGLESLAEIVAVPGVDVVFLGLADLALSEGYPGGPADPDLQLIVSEAIERIVGAGKVAGLGVADAEAAARRLEQSVGLLVVNVADLVTQGSRAFLRFRTSRSGS